MILLERFGGRVSEVLAGSAPASLSMAMSLVLQAQGQGQAAAWIEAGPGSFFPPDATAAGVDLSALPVVRVSGLREAARAADKLLRSGAFDLLVADLGGKHGTANSGLPMPLQSRLLGLARKHATALLFLTGPGKDGRDHGPLGTLIPARLLATRGLRGERGFECRLEAIKDKGGSPGWSYTEIRRGPPGLR